MGVYIGVPLFWETTISACLHQLAMVSSFASPLCPPLQHIQLRWHAKLRMTLPNARSQAWNVASRKNQPHQYSLGLRPERHEGSWRFGSQPSGCWAAGLARLVRHILLQPALPRCAPLFWPSVVSRSCWSSSRTSTRARRYTMRAIATSGLALAQESQEAMSTEIQRSRAKIFRILE